MLLQKKIISRSWVRSREVTRSSDGGSGKTVIEGDENSEISEKFFALARKLLESEETEKEDI